MATVPLPGLISRVPSCRRADKMDRAADGEQGGRKPGEREADAKNDHCCSRDIDG